MSGEPQLEEPICDPDVLAAWAQYAKERHDAAEKRLADFRNWARQLAAAVGVVVGLEAALMGQLLKLGEASASGLAQGVCLVLLLGTAAFQIVILVLAVRAGYAGQALLGAESPAVLAGHLAGKDEAWALRTIGAYYAKGADSIHTVAEAVAKRVAGLARCFAWSLCLLFVTMSLVGGLTVLSSHVRKAMPETPASPGPAPAASASEPAAQPSAQVQPPAAAPASPLLVTPTPGQVETHDLQPSARPAILSTPTPGQWLTEGIQRR